VPPHEKWSPATFSFPFEGNRLIADVGGGHRCLDIRDGAIGRGGKVDICNCLSDDLAQQFTVVTFERLKQLGG
jgi:hypothetical protein